MKTIEEIRRDWLEKLIGDHKTIAALNEAIGRPRTDATLAQIRNQSPDSRSGRARNMGSDQAREIEIALNLERGTLDHPVRGAASPTVVEINTVRDNQAGYQIRSNNNNGVQTLYERAAESTQAAINLLLLPPLDRNNLSKKAIRAIDTIEDDALNWLDEYEKSKKSNSQNPA